ncbi:unnamed protein product [Protopolystoma xenopodis]|uniref:C2H2-type domain-containing protein n=1 Tax=Protopolystoma xenopodis TaxID=117903 RepID=A0A3S5ATZ2_9PLAT|nr:unnamed protein product [Protopolystoma xenopodis]
MSSVDTLQLPNSDSLPVEEANEKLGSAGFNNVATRLSEKVHKTFDSDTDSESSTDDEDRDTSDDDRRMANNPVLKERLRQLDKYASNMRYAQLSPGRLPDAGLPSLFSGSSAVGKSPYLVGDIHPSSGAILGCGKNSGPSDVAESNSTPSECRSQQHSIMESPIPCSEPTSRYTFSPPYGSLMNVGVNVSNPGCEATLPQNRTAHGLIHTAPNPLVGISKNTLTHASASLGYRSASINDNPDSTSLSFRKIGSIESREDDSTNEDIDVEDDEADPMDMEIDGKEYTCELCNAIYTNRSSLRSHMKKHAGQIVKRHQCDKCPYSTQYGKNLLKHMESMHTDSGERHYRCEICSKLFFTSEELQDHERLHTPSNTYRCDECGRAFKTKLRLKYHSDVHNPRKPYICDVDGCDRAFRTPKYLKNHRDEFHGMQPKQYNCPVDGCSLVFHRKTHLKRHIDTHEG